MSVCGNAVNECPQNISSQCTTNVSTWTLPGGYLDTGLVPNLYPPNGTDTNNETIQHAVKFVAPLVTSTPGGIGAVAISAFSGLVYIAAILALVL